MTSIFNLKDINIEHDKRKVVIYARVSTKNQRDDLQNQTAFLRQFCNARGMIVDQCIEDYGSGLNYNRRKWEWITGRSHGAEGQNHSDHA